MTIGRLAGLSSFFIEGASVSAKEGFEYQESSTTREPLMAMDGSIAGYSEKGDAPYMSLTLYSGNGVSAGALYRMQGVQLLCQLANGGTVTGHSMTMMEPPKVNNDEGTFEAKWIGSVTETLP